MTDVNRVLFEFLFRWSGQNAAADVFIVALAQFLPYFLALGFVAWLFSRPTWKIRWLLFAESTLGVILARGIITEAVRFFYYSARPSELLNFAALIAKSGASFPSGHAAFFFALATTAFYYNRRLGWWVFGISLAISLGRILAGVHWPLDILGGMGIGILSAAFAHWLIRPQLKQLEEKTPTA